MINTPGYSSEFAVNNLHADVENLAFNFSEVKRFLIEFMPNPNDIGKEIQVRIVLTYFLIFTMRLPFFSDWCYKFVYGQSRAVLY